MRVPYFENCFLEFCDVSVRDVRLFRSVELRVLWIAELHVGQVVFAWRTEKIVEYRRKLLAMIQCASVNASDGVADR